MTHTRLVETLSHSKSTVVLCIVLLPLTQAGLGYLSLSFPLVFIGAPICSLFICALSAACAAGGLGPARARRNGILVGTLGGIGGVSLSVLILALLAFWSFQNSRAQMQGQCSSHPAHYCGYGFGLGMGILLDYIVPAFLAIEVLSLVLAPLGGMLGGQLRASLEQKGQSTQEQPGKEV